VYPWIDRPRCIEIEPIVSAPTPLRNKCEFTIGYRYLFDETATDNDSIENTNESKDGTTAAPQPDVAEGELKGDNSDQPITEQREPRKVPACGFLVTGWAGGVSFSDSLNNIPSEGSALVKIMNDFLATSPLEPYDTTTHTGFWRLLTVRTSRRTQECMVIIQHTPVSGGAGDANSNKEDSSSPLDYTEAFAIEKERLIAVLTKAILVAEEAELPPLKVTSIFFQEFGGLSTPPPEHPVQHAYGKTHLTEKLGKCLFQISPGAFFQVNTGGAEMLYQLAVEKVREVSSENPEKTLLFDVCCGTGTIGLTMMKEGVVGSVVGVDISEPAIEDAKKNAELNGFACSDDGNVDDKNNGSQSSKSTRFVAARAEQVLADEIRKAKKRHKDMNFIVVVDPAREGLHADVVKTIRMNEQISRLVYVSCNPTATLTRDAVLLCCPPTKRYTGRPFRVTSAAPVDMFPLTNHCEMVMTFDRVSDAEMSNDTTATKK